MSCIIRHRTPLYEAANQGHVDMCRLLVSANADPSARDGCDKRSSACGAPALLRVTHAVSRRDGFTILHAVEIYGEQYMAGANTEDVCRFLREIDALDDG